MTPFDVARDPRWRAAWEELGFGHIVPTWGASRETFTAYEEAAHTVFFYGQGRPAPATVSIIPDARTNGRVIPVNAADSPDQVIASLATAPTEIRDVRLARAIDICMAGPAGRSLGEGRLAYDWAKTIDLANARAYCAALYGLTDSPVELHYAWCREILAELPVWRAVRAVTAKLLARKELSGEEAYTCFAALIPDKRGTVEALVFKAGRQQ